MKSRKRFLRKFAGEVKGAKVASPEKAAAVAEDCEVIISTGPAGVEIPPGGILPKLEKCMVAVDVNAFSLAG